MNGRRFTDWKDVANSYYEKAISLAILLLLFSFLVSPKIEVRPYVAEIRVTEAIEIPPEIRERIEPPAELMRPPVEIIIDDDLMGDDDDLEIVETIDRTVLDPYEVVQRPPGIGETPRFVIYEDPPIPVRKVEPDYPTFARRSNIQGQVILEVEVLRDGTVGAVNVLRSLMAGPGGLDESAVRAVKQWEFTPAKSGGQPVAVWARIPIDFTLE